MARNASASSSASLLSFGLFRERTWRRGAAASRRCLVVSYFDKRWVTGCRYASWLGGARWLVVRVWRYDTETSILRRYGSWTYTTTATTFFFSRSGGGAENAGTEITRHINDRPNGRLWNWRCKYGADQLVPHALNELSWVRYKAFIICNKGKERKWRVFI